MRELMPEWGQPGEFRDLEAILAGRTPRFVRNPHKLFGRTTAMFMILHSEEDKLKRWIAAAKAGHYRLPSIDYQKLLQYKPFCDCVGCIGPCLRLAFKEGLIHGTTFKQIKTLYRL
jgi:hypothetical protein